MRLPSRRRRAAGRPEPLASGLLALATLAPLLSHAIEFKPVPSANVDFSNLGRIVIAGDYNGISLHEFEGQISKPLSTNGSESLLTRLPDGILVPIVSTDASIRTMCTFKQQNGGLNGVIIGGNFTSLDGTESTAIALFNPNTTKVTSLTGLEGEVNAVYCDQERETVYVGGNFKGANSTNALAWLGTKGWTNLPFAGFNGPVEAITKASNGHIIFGGSFTGLGNASTPSQPDDQIINLSTANVTATNSASTNGFNDPKSVVCAAGSGGAGKTWLLRDQTPGAWEAKFGFGFEPTKLRLWNTNQDGRGTKTFRFLAFPLNGIMNLTYVDPATGQNATCTSECPLSHDPNVKYQDFRFVNRVGMNSFQIAISDWYGSGAGLAGVELFQDDIFAYAIADFNEPSCGGVELPSTATSTGPWKHSPSAQSSSDYLTAQLSGDITPQSASITFSPSIRESGNYSVNMYTPGCKPDETCDTRGRVNVTGTMSTGTINAEFSATLFQTNNFDKYDQIYFGYIEKTSDSFKPSVTITPLAGQGVEQLTIVAQRVGFTLINSTGGLNGLFDFDPDNGAASISDLDKSEINKLGSGFERNSAVKSLVTSGDVTYIGGNFTSDTHVNIVSVRGPKNEAQSLDGGLNGQVLNMHLEDSKLYAGGDFNNTNTGGMDGLNHVAVYDTKANSWSALGAGVDGPVENVVPLLVNVTSNTTETVITFTGTFSKCNGFGNNEDAPVDGFAIWVPSKGNWLQNLAGPVPTYSGILSAAVLDLPNNDTLFAGSMSSALLGANGAATLSDAGLGKLPVNIQAQRAASKVSRRDGLSAETLRGVVTGTFYDNGNSNITILAGHFTAQSKNGSTINNLVFIDGSDQGSVSGLGPGVSVESTFSTVALHGSVLYAGGKVSGAIDDNQINGLVAYDMKAKAFANQPAPVAGGNGTVSAISVRPDTSEVYVAGAFTKAGALDCPGICVYNADSDQWIQPGNGLAGEVLSLMWSSDSTLIAGGNMLANGTNKRYIASYNAKKQTWAAFAGADSIPGPVQVMTPASGDANQVWIAGKSAKDGAVFLMKYDGSSWLSAKETLSASTVLRSLQVFTLTKSHDKTDILDDKQVLMLTGSINIPNVGTVSAAIYNGTHYQPYALTTNSGNGAGSIAKIFTQKDNFFSSGDNHMPLVFVVLIGLAISLALVLLLVLGGIVLDRLRKKREGYTPAPTSMYDRGSGIQRIPPHELLVSLGKSRPAAPHV
ncbi:Bud site selection protein RAX2 [Tolypocladium ophioglossoides CBS 100239]|uniref:Bud site selection protein RAX2 n=1 Tax=Tolypocladium ophioglossoides (strain CBS 100239) TaxID=1163406 RepID=A0A0L0NKU5_TOLOC|nr:Bud site selection protein RAX2 [Tolypocladium ophioglossoides CBS 100239]